MTTHQFGGIEYEAEPVRRWRGKCQCGHVGEWTTDKEAAWAEITGHFVQTPEFQTLVARGPM